MGRTKAGNGREKAVFGYNPARGVCGGQPDMRAAGKGSVSGRLFFAPTPESCADAAARAGISLPAWVIDRLRTRRGEVVVYSGDKAGPVFLMAPAENGGGDGHGGQLALSPFGAARDIGGIAAAQAWEYTVNALEVHTSGADDEHRLGLLTGLELGAYKFKGLFRDGTGAPFRVVPDKVTAKQQAGASAIGRAVNLARHLTNLPPADLHPESFAETADTLVRGMPGMSVKILDRRQLEKAGLTLLSAVGRGAAHGPALVHIRYRPARSGKRAPLALVGKGVTFDTGGLDIKDAASMRLMKKDMAGAATVLALAWYAGEQGLDRPLDFYLALAENAVDQHAFHPSDIIRTKAGFTVEIDNTDAEGRLVMADAFTMAVQETGRDRPSALINFATLTGAMRIALGTRVAGFFATHDELAGRLLAAGKKRAEPMWRMPLVAEYNSHLKSVTADVANSGPNRFGGAISAAMFLRKFSGDVPWAHVDMYGWCDPPVGGLSEAGGNGQCVQLMTDFLVSPE